MAIAVPLSGFFSYCADLEDLILTRFLADIEHGFYVDVGACLPVAGSVTKAFYERHWSGINIEPLPEYYAALCFDRPRDINLQTGISNCRGEAQFYTCGGLSTLNRETANRIENVQHESFTTVEIDLCTLNDVFDVYVKHKTVHFLKIDVETHELEVIQSLDFNKYMPWIICVESTFPYTMEPLHEQWEKILIQNDYQFALQHSVNRYYIHKYKFAERMHVFETNDFDVMYAGQTAHN